MIDVLLAVLGKEFLQCGFYSYLCSEERSVTISGSSATILNNRNYCFSTPVNHWCEVNSMMGRPNG